MTVLQLLDRPPRHLEQEARAGFVAAFLELVDDAVVGVRRIVVSETEIPNMLAITV